MGPPTSRPIAAMANASPIRKLRSHGGVSVHPYNLADPKHAPNFGRMPGKRGRRHSNKGENCRRAFCQLQFDGGSKCDLHAPDHSPYTVAKATTPAASCTPNSPKMVTAQHADESARRLNTPNRPAKRPGIMRPGIEPTLRIVTCGSGQGCSA